MYASITSNLAFGTDSLRVALQIRCTIVTAVVSLIAGCAGSEPPTPVPVPSLEKRESDAKTHSAKERDRQAIERLSTVTGADRGWESFLTSDRVNTPAFTFDFQESLAPHIGQRILVVGTLDDVLKTPSGVKVLCTYLVPWNADRWSDTRLVFVLDASDSLHSKLRAEMEAEESDDFFDRQIAVVVIPRTLRAIPRRELRAFIDVEEGDQGQREAEVQEGNLETILRIDGECVDIAYLGTDFP